MTGDDAGDGIDVERIAPDMYGAPPRLRTLMPFLRAVPAPLAAWMLAGLAVGEGVVHRHRLRSALAWAAAQGATGTAKWRLALALFANHGRFVAQETMIGVPDLRALSRNVVIEGREHLDRLRTGALLLGFHLGPPRTALVLRACGYPVRVAGRLEMARGNPRWDAALDASEAVALPAGPPRGRAESLHRIRDLIRGGAIVYIAADGLGREAFRIDVPGGSLVVRMGWLALRRATRLPVLPVFTWMRGRQRVIDVHPPLPDPCEDAGQDAAVCRAALAPLLADYVRRVPAQCRYLVVPPRPRGAPATEA